uniref:FAS1 domain-containing protein n=1 Tax=Macrostomum lignano TaxID=282301 RepID=A0A1I8JS87_9PLAT
MGLQMNTTGSCSAIRCFLVFAPSNTALDDAYKADSVGFNALDKTKLVQHHYIAAAFGGSKAFLSDWASQGTPVGEDIGFRPGDHTQAPGRHPVLGGQADVVADSNKEGDAGVFHVLDQVLLPIGSTQDTANFFSSGPSSSIANQLGIQKSLTIFNDWMQRDTTYSYVYSALRGGQSLQGAHHLSAVRRGLGQNPERRDGEAENSLADEFRKVLVAHFAPNITVFTTWMNLSSSSIKFSTGFNTVAWYNDSRMYLNSASKAFVSVGGVVAQFVDKSINYPLGNAIIHVVDRGARLRPRRPALAGADQCARVLPGLLRGAQLPEPAEQQWHPADAVCTADVTSLASLSPASTAGSSQSLEQLLMLHFVPGIVFKAEHEGVRPADCARQLRPDPVPDMKMRHSLLPAEYYVEGRLPNRGFVRAELTMFDQPAKNGIFHKVIRVLGQPVQTVKDFINSHEDLSRVRQFMGSNEFQPNLGDSQMAYTVFPPSNAAMAAFSGYKNSKEVSIGAVIFERQPAACSVVWCCRTRRLSPTSPQPGVTEFATANTAENEKITVNLKGSAGLTTRFVEITGSFVMANISLAAGEYECTNGMVYPSSQVLFRDNDVEGYTRSGPSRRQQQLGGAGDEVAQISPETLTKALLDFPRRLEACLTNGGHGVHGQRQHHRQPQDEVEHHREVRLLSASRMPSSSAAAASFGAAISERPTRMSSAAGPDTVAMATKPALGPGAASASRPASLTANSNNPAAGVGGQADCPGCRHGGALGLRVAAARPEPPPGSAKGAGETKLAAWVSRAGLSRQTGGGQRARRPG